MPNVLRMVSKKASEKLVQWKRTAQRNSALKEAEEKTAPLRRLLDDVEEAARKKVFSE